MNETTNLDNVDKVAKVDKKEICYSEHSKEYDENRLIGSRNEYLESIRKQTVLKQLSSIPTDAQILDVGCGTGRGLMYLVEGGYTNLTGVDYTQEMLDRAAPKFENLPSGQTVKLMQGNAFELEFEPESYDAVITMNFLHMFRLDRQCELLRGIHRVCRKGGLVVAEFESMHKGLFISRYPEQRRVANTTKFNSVWEMKELFPRDLFSDVNILGAELPLAHHLFHRIPNVGRSIESTITRLPVLKWASSRIVVAARIGDGFWVWCVTGTLKRDARLIAGAITQTLSAPRPAFSPSPFSRQPARLVCSTLG